MQNETDVASTGLYSSGFGGVVRTIPAEDGSDRHGHGSDYVEQELAHDNPRRRRESPADREADDGHASGKESIAASPRNDRRFMTSCGLGREEGAERFGHQLGQLVDAFRIAKGSEMTAQRSPHAEIPLSTHL